MIRPLYSFKSVDIANLISNGTAGSTGANPTGTINGYNFYTGAIQTAVNVSPSNPVSFTNDPNFGNPLPCRFKGTDGADMISYYSAYFEEFKTGTNLTTPFPSNLTNGVGANGRFRAIVIGAGGGGGGGGGGGYSPILGGGSNQQNGGGGGGGGGGAYYFINKTPIGLNESLKYTVGVGGTGGLGQGGGGTDGGDGNATLLTKTNLSIYIAAEGGFGGKGGLDGSNNDKNNGPSGDGGVGGGRGEFGAPVETHFGNNGGKSGNKDGGPGGYTPSCELNGLKSISVASDPGENGTLYGQGGGGGYGGAGKGSGLDGGDGASGYIRIYYLLE